jgi:23S rRNA G2445 N2-methylase RlmL
MDYWGVDISPVAVGMAESLVAASGLSDRCRFEVWDLDDGLPPGESVDLLFCHMFRDPRFTKQWPTGLEPGGCWPWRP